MLVKLSDKLGNWNPQLFREIKGRLKIRHVAIATFLSLIAQGILMFCFWAELPKIAERKGDYNRYCTKYFPVGIKEHCQAIDWNLWWDDIFQFFSWGFLIVLVLAGIYMLVADLAKEKRLGTLNFISLSPQSSQKVLLGKLLGVPILLYLVIALAIPLHLWSAYQANLSLNLILIWYGILVAISYFFYSASLAFVFLGGTQAWLASILGGVCLFLNYFIIFVITGGYFVGKEYLAWFVLQDIGDAVFVTYSLFLCVCLSLGYLFWQTANRLFRNPNATILSKKQSYFWVAEFQIFVLGFGWHLIHTTSKYNFDIFWTLLCCLMNLICFLLLIGCLSPHRQTLQDWARYKHQQTSTTNSAIVKNFGRSLISDLIWGEKSPAVLAIAINLVITAAIWLPWIFLSRQQGSLKGEYAIGLIFTLSMILIYAAIAQIALLSKTKQRAALTVVVLASLIFLLPIPFFLISPVPEQLPLVWLFSAIPFTAVKFASANTLFLAFLAHLSILGLLSFQLTRKLQKAGESASKKLLADSASRFH